MINHKFATKIPRKPLALGVSTILFGFLGAVACQKPEVFPDLGLKVKSPIDVIATEDNNYFLVLNADLDRVYNSGSILTIDRDGNKISALPMPRLGRAMVAAGNDLLVINDREGPDGPGGVHLIDISDPTKPTISRSWSVSCSPVNGSIRKGYKYFVVTCTNGSLYVGTLEANRSASSLKLVRDYGMTRRALYIDPRRQLLLMFPTDLAKQTLIDRVMTDESSRALDAPTKPNNDNTPIEGANEVPDEYEKDRKARLNKGQRQTYQFVVYDFAQESQKIDPNDGTPFVFKSFAQSEGELRWIYFSLTNFDGYPDSDVGFTNLKSKHYRTNFWTTQPDPLSDDSFYLSHRGGGESPNANHVIRVTISGNLLPAGTTNPKTSDVLSFERVYGFSGELVPERHYPGDFDVALVKGRPLIVVNHFKDQVFFAPGKTNFSVAAKILGENYWHEEVIGPDPTTSYYQVALNSLGRAISCSYYGDAVILLDVIPGTGITALKRVD